MPIFKDSMREEFPEYDFGIIEQRASELQPEERFSQAREAKKLEPMIRAIVAAHPRATAAAIADMFTAARRSDDDLGPTFRREVGTLVRAIKTDVNNEFGDPRKSQAAGSHARRRREARESKAFNVAVPPPTFPGAAAAVPVDAGQSAGDFPIEVSGVPLSGPRAIPAASATVASPSAGSAPAPVSAAGTGRPYRFNGKFAGMVFKHGSELRNFFSAVEKHLSVQQIAQLVGPVLASPVAQAKVADLEPADRAIFEAMEKWAKDHGI